MGPVRREERDVSQVGAAIGGLGAVVVGVVLVPWRSEIHHANLALILVVVVVAAAIVGGRLAGAVAAVAATLSFDFFLTKPYLSMRVNSTDDMETVLVLLTVGLLVGEVAARGRRSRRHRDRALESVARVQRVASLVALGEEAEGVTAAVTAELTALLHLDDCWLELPPGLWVMPRLERGGSISSPEHDWAGDGFTLSPDGTDLPVYARGHEIARFVLIGNPAVAVTLEQRVVAVALADQLGGALATAEPAVLHRLAHPDHHDHRD